MSLDVRLFACLSVRPSHAGIVSKRLNTKLFHYLALSVWHADQLAATYCGLPITESYKFDTELVSRIITELKRGKAVDIDGLSAEHLQFCHPVLSVILQKLFNFLCTGWI